MPRRFNNPKPTMWGRIGHPAPLDRKLVRCAGVTFEDRQTGQMWTLRKYEAYSNEWPEVDVWTVRDLLPVKDQDKRNRGMGYGNQRKVEEADVPADVREFALSTLVMFRLRGRVHA
jgi:hypothetical protein